MAPRSLLIAAAIALLGLTAVAGQEVRVTTPDNLADVAVRSFRIHPDANVYMLAGAGSNVTVQFGTDGVLVVDTEFEPMADRLLAEIKRLAGDRIIRYVINTHSHLDHVGGNAKFRAAGQTILAGNVALDLRDSGATILAHEQTQVRMAQPGIDGQFPPSTWLPTET